MDDQRTKWRRNVAENFNRLSRSHESYRQTDSRRQTDDTDDNSEREHQFTFDKTAKIILGLNAYGICTGALTRRSSITTRRI